MTKIQINSLKSFQTCSQTTNVIHALQIQSAIEIDSEESVRCVEFHCRRTEGLETFFFSTYITGSIACRHFFFILHLLPPGTNQFIFSINHSSSFPSFRPPTRRDEAENNSCNKIVYFFQQEPSLN